MIQTKNPALQAIANDPVLMEQRVQLWSEDFLLWFFDNFFTKDEGRGEERVAPKFAYIKSLHETIEAERITWVEKSRQLFVTWYMVARFLWKLMYGKDIRLIYGSRVESDVRDVIKTRFEEAYNRLDQAFPIPELIFRSLSIENPSRGTLMTGMSSSGQGSRGKTGAELWLDEIAFQDHQESLIRSSMESMNSPNSKIIGVTTPNAEEYALAVKLLIAKTIDPMVPPIELSKGVTKKFNTKGHCVLSVSHWAHPEKQEAWREAKIKEIGETSFSLEHGLNWDVAKGKPVFWGFDYDKHQKQNQLFDPLLPLHIGVDPGTGHPAAVFFQRGRDRKCRILHAFTLEQTDTVGLMQHIERDIVERFNAHEDFYFWLDPAGLRANSQGSSIVGDDIYNYFRRPVDAPDKTSPIDRVRIINDMFANDMIEVQEHCGEYWHADGSLETSAFVFMLTTGYACNQRGEPVKDNKWDHFADAFGYGFICVFDTARDIGARSTAEFSVRPDYYNKLMAGKPQAVRKNFLEI